VQRGLDRGFEIGLCRHVSDRIVHENSIELASEPYRAHVALNVLALGIQSSTDLKHVG
jgi:hypothetical protein